MDRLEVRMADPQWMVEQQRASMLADGYDWSSEPFKKKKAHHLRCFEKWVRAYLSEERKSGVGIGIGTEDQQKDISIEEYDVWNSDRILQLMPAHIPSRLCQWRHGPAAQERISDQLPSS